jgi:sugar/nucleoside kinase (ribokinase family)
MTSTSNAEEAITRLGEIVPVVAVKCGSRGALVRYDGVTHHAEPVVVDTVDTVGAGDSFNAGFLHGWLRGLSPELAAREGNIVGALSAQRSGGTEAFRDAELMKSFLASYPLPSAS